MLHHHEIKRRREAARLSQQDAADKGRLPGGYQAWWNVENGRRPMPRLDTLLAIARALECSIADIVVEQYPPGKPAKAQGKQREKGQSP